MIASLNMKHGSTSGGGVDGAHAEDLDDINIANAHMHFRTAKRDLERGESAYKRCGDVLAQHMAEFRPIFLCGESNMALFVVALS